MVEATLAVRVLKNGNLSGFKVLDAVAAGKKFTAFFTRKTDASDVRAAFGGKKIGAVNGAPIISFQNELPVLEVADPEPELFAGRNVAVGTRNGEPVHTIIEWLVYHFDYFGMDGAVIFNRTPAGKDAAFLNELKSELAKVQRPLQVVVVESHFPLGLGDMPAEHHPYCVSEAPGHDRMEIPESDPWLAPLGEVSIYEIARARFLQQARAVANLDVCDLLYDPAVEAGPKSSAQVENNPFEIAASAPGQMVHLIGTHCYPWRVRKNTLPCFADHVCLQFDRPKLRNRWCVSPEGLKSENFMKFRRISKVEIGATAPFFRCMSIRHPVSQSSKIVPKTSLVEAESLIAIAKNVFDFKPVRAPSLVTGKKSRSKSKRTAIVTTMKNEGPFILEWIAYHQAIGVKDFLVYTNDCDDGTDTMFNLLQSKGIVQHRQNPFREMDLKPQHAALQAAENEQIMKKADWIICMDVDEFINIKVGKGHLRDLYEAIGNANMISCTWRLFGSSDLDNYEDDFTIKRHTKCAPEYSPKPHQAWGFKTLFRNNGIFKKFGVHRPKGLRPQLWDQINWVNGSGEMIAKTEFRNSWRSTSSTYGYDLVSLNHYAVRNAESFLVKRDRGRVNHVDRDQGEAYWFRMNNNATEDLSIQRRIPMMERKLKKLMADPEIAAQHKRCVDAHQAKIAELLTLPDQQEFYNILTGRRMEKLSRMHQHFGASVFLAGPRSVPDEIIDADHAEDFEYTVERTETQH
ncbi:Glycosyl transferase, group 2 family protein [Sulfitobacter noctilucae]|uniref:glycosyltransferase family 2 protein n=1 Tax=Sulfitobacter noctilucae TaxID=1342302 RepID=UPI0004680738|nr:glycosyltransferase family 2 protein [Sulfitobacter noctilucae]KIN70659.1 Glycosyl transferase, group 2 family protein [Sulfitobacter noctilucae]